MGILDYLKNPNVMNQLMMAGEAFKAADQSRPANLAPFMERSEQLQGQERMNKMRQKLVEGGLLQRMLQQRGYSPESLGVLTSALEAAPGAVLPQVLSMAFPQNSGDPYARYEVVPGLGVVDLEKFRTGEGNGVVAAAPERSDPYSDIGKLRADLNAGRITQEEFNAKVAKITSAGGIAMRFNPETGEMEFTTNAGPEWSSKTRADLETRELDARDTLARLDRIKSNIIDNPDIINLGRYAERFGAGVLNEMDKLGVDLNAEDRKFLQDMTAARGDILENLNFTIKAITGAAMTEAEAKRIGETLPGVTDGPVVFQAKLERAIEAQRMAVARYNYWRMKGMGGKPWEFETISGMKNLIKKRGEELAKAVREKTMTAEEAEATFFKEFGI